MRLLRSPRREACGSFVSPGRHGSLGDLALLEDVRHSFRKCDGYRIFSDRRPIGNEDDVDIVVVNVTQQPTSRGES